MLDNPGLAINLIVPGVPDKHDTGCIAIINVDRVPE